MSKPTSNSSLNWKVFVTPAIATVNDDLPPGETARMWSPTSSILIYGERDAILVDTPATTAEATALADWVEKSGKNLTTIYTTHGHGDHFFGNGTLLERFRGAKAIAAPKVRCNADALSQSLKSRGSSGIRSRDQRLGFRRLHYDCFPAQACSM